MAERLTRAAVIDRAASLSDDIGLEALTITKLGRSLGIAPPGVYRHVTDLSDLRGALGQQAAREIAGVLSAACAGLSGRTPGRARPHPAGMGRPASGPVRGAPGRPDPGDVAGQTAAGELIAVIASALRAYRLADDDLTDAIRLIRSTLHGFVALEQASGFKQARSVDATFARVIASSTPCSPAGRPERQPADRLVSDEQERPRFFVAGRPLLPLGEAVGQIEEVIPVNVSTWVLLSEVTVGR